MNGRKLSEQQFKSIEENFPHYSNKKLAEMFGSSQNTVWRLGQQHGWQKTQVYIDDNSKLRPARKPVALKQPASDYNRLCDELDRIENRLVLCEKDEWEMLVKQRNILTVKLAKYESKAVIGAVNYNIKIAQ